MDFEIPILVQDEQRQIGFNPNLKSFNFNANPEEREEKEREENLDFPPLSLPTISSLEAFYQNLSNLQSSHQDQNGNGNGNGNQPFRFINVPLNLNLPEIKSTDSFNNTLPPLTPLPPLPIRYQCPVYRIPTSEQLSNPLESISQSDHQPILTKSTENHDQEPKQVRLLSWDQFHEQDSQQPRDQTQQSPFFTDWRPNLQGEDGNVQAGVLSSEDINEVLLQSLDPRYAEPSSSTSNLKQPSRPAPSYPASSVLSSLLVTISGTISSTHFHWNESNQRFLWAGALERTTLLIQAHEARAKESKGKSRAESNDKEIPVFQWKGGERIRGWSQSTSDSIIQRFLHVATHLRRLEIRVEDLRNGKNSCPEAHSLGFALETVLGWLKEELRIWDRNTRENDKGAGIMTAWKGLEESEEILDTLAEMMSCSYSRSPPFKDIPRVSSTKEILSHIHSYLLASISSHSSLLLQAILSYILTISSESWRIDVSSWIGWPGSKTNKPDFETLRGNLESNLTSLGGRSKKSVGEFEPWSGMGVEWGNDERGEEDLGYVLRNKKLPRFLSISNARDLLEAGRALRLLKRAAPLDHPLLNLNNDDQSSSSSKTLGTSLNLPGWIWNEKEAELHSKKVEERVKNLRREVAKWRRRRMDGSSVPPSSDPPNISSDEPKLITIPLSTISGLLGLPSSTEGPPGLSSLSRMLSLFNSSPGSLDSQLPTTSTSFSNLILRASNSRLEFYQYLAKILIPLHSSTSSNSNDLNFNLRSLLPSSTPSLPVLTKRVFVSPLLKWSSLINSALISVFFKDLGLGIYLETCRQFLLLGSHTFFEAVSETLFDGDGADSEKDLVENVETGRIRGIGLSRKLNNCLSWPPDGSELTSTLMSAVVETVSDMRVSDARRLALHEEQGSTSNLTGTTIALKDLDERLSFAISHPDSKKRDPKNWKNPQSIEALDWLTLSFFPPPLISPLLTSHASMLYQRIFNFLLRIMRVQSAIRGLNLDTFKSSNTRKRNSNPKARNRKQKEEEEESKKFNLLPFEDHPPSRNLLLRFKNEVQHFNNCLGSFVSDISINDGWNRFQSRLNQLSKDAEMRDHASYASSNDRHDDDDVVAGYGEDFRDDQDGETEFDQEDDQDQDFEDSNRSGNSSFELKDVFSLARYHESVLDRMLQTCFLKARQRGVMKIITDLQQITLDLSFLIREMKLSSLPSTLQQRKKLISLYTKFFTRFNQLIKTLHMIKDRSKGMIAKTSVFSIKEEKETLERILGQNLSGLDQQMDSDKVTEMELKRQELESLKDFQLLQGDDGSKGRKDREIVEIFITRLDLFNRKM